jgi:alkylated DNA nucleotide flippase Atl1
MPRHDTARDVDDAGDVDEAREPEAPERYVEAVLNLVEQIPAGRASTYGTIAEAVGRGGPRGVGRVMATYGGGVPWWRVVRADGSLPPSHQGEALARYRAEETPLRGSLADAETLRIDLRSAFWDDFRASRSDIRGQ